MPHSAGRLRDGVVRLLGCDGLTFLPAMHAGWDLWPPMVTFVSGLVATLLLESLGTTAGTGFFFDNPLGAFAVALLAASCASAGASSAPWSTERGERSIRIGERQECLRSSPEAASYSCPPSRLRKRVAPSRFASDRVSPPGSVLTTKPRLSESPRPNRRGHATLSQPWARCDAATLGLRF